MMGEFSATTLVTPIYAHDKAMRLVNTKGFPPKGALIINRIDPNGCLNEISREIVTYEGKTGNWVHGLRRGLGGTVAQSHHSGTIIEFYAGFTPSNDERNLGDYLKELL